MTVTLIGPFVRRVVPVVQRAGLESGTVQLAIASSSHSFLERRSLRIVFFVLALAASDALCAQPPTHRSRYGVARGSRLVATIGVDRYSGHIEPRCCPRQRTTLTPAYRPGAVLETIPGLTVASHSGEGKANQYLMRGFNLDHGTDLTVFVDGMPINEPTHAHGQGYTDLNFLVPEELVTGVTFTKGPYFADEGDFASVGSIHINYLDAISNQISVSLGSLGYRNSWAVAP